MLVAVYVVPLTVTSTVAVGSETVPVSCGVLSAVLMEVTVTTGAVVSTVDLSGAVLVDVQLETAYCDWATKLPEGIELTCKGVTLQRK